MSARIAASALALAALAACAPKDPHSLGHKLVVHGVVTDAATAQPLQGVKVTLLGSDGFPSITTDARGYFRFLNVLQIHNLLVQFQRDGYDTVTAPVNPSVVRDGGTPDGGVLSFPGFGEDVDGFDASMALTQSLSLSVAGWVRAGPDAAKDAAVILADAAGRVAYRTTAGGDGRFTFSNVRAATYQLWVLPFDRDADGVTEYQFFNQSLSVLATTANLSNVVVNLRDVSQRLESGSFVNLSASYPLTAAQLATGVTALLQSPGPFFLHFGAEVDAALAQFELVQVETGGRVSPPIGLQVSWDKGVIATLTPAVALQPHATGAISYQLRIRSLRFRDGTVMFPPSGAAFGAINFTVGQLPALLASPAPSFHLGAQATATQKATQAIVDASTIWLLDANGDFVFDTVAAQNWSSGNLPQLQWQHVPGAVRYRVMARNTTSAGGNAGATLGWRELATVVAPDPNLNPTIVASVSFFGAAGLGFAGLPWAFGNGVEIAVTAEDVHGFSSNIDATKLLTTRDSFGGLITSVAQDAALPGAFAATVERGSSFTKSFRIDFSEPMSALSPIGLASGSANLTVAKINATAWGTAAAPSATPVNTATSAYVNVALSIRGACTELMLDRVAGDKLVPVRDSSLFAAGAASRAVILNAASGAFVTELIDLAKVDPGMITLAAGVPGAAGATIATRGSLACSLQAPAKLAKAVTISSASASVVVDDASLFTIGETILVYLPQTAGAGQIADLRTIAGLDTATNTIVLSAVPTAGHSTSTVVLPMNLLGAEAALRASLPLALAQDTAGGNDVEVVLTAAAALMAGDTVLVDADGDLKTTTDQAQVKVKTIKMAAAPFSFTADLPAGLQLLRGRARVTALGDSLAVTGARDTSWKETATRNLDPHRDQFTADGLLF